MKSECPFAGFKSDVLRPVKAQKGQNSQRGIFFQPTIRFCLFLHFSVMHSSWNKNSRGPASGNAKRGEGEDELADNALESLIDMGECVVQPIIQELPKANDAGREALLEVLANWPGPEQTYRLAEDLFQKYFYLYMDDCNHWDQQIE